MTYVKSFILKLDAMKRYLYLCVSLFRQTKMTFWGAKTVKRFLSHEFKNDSALNRRSHQSSRGNVN